MAYCNIETLYYLCIVFPSEGRSRISETPSHSQLPVLFPFPLPPLHAINVWKLTIHMAQKIESLN